jgi:hypothetical protein
MATRGGMRRHEANCHLEYARLYHAIDARGGDIAAKHRYDGAAKAKVS